MEEKIRGCTTGCHATTLILAVSTERISVCRQKLMQAWQLTQPEVADAIQCLMQRQAADDAAAERKKQEEDKDKRCKLAAKEEVKELRRQLQALEEKIRGLEAEVQKIRARPREIKMVESKEASLEEET
jgi:polyhydroxyalkanoate synthesis regulator phasin